MLATSFLSGCIHDVLDPTGSVGDAEKSLIAWSTWIMLIVVVPVIVLTLWFALRLIFLGLVSPETNGVLNT